jgi:hypothetical protein
MLMRLSGDMWPETLVTQKTNLICKEIVSINSKDGYMYVGITTKENSYMSEYTKSDELEKEIERQCE